ncbi:MAG: Sporulation related domain protein [Candidatus Latescibacteria bacterium ADurb.Bin168]|nr:MAG: Sporulation related domain protein [Candidatus Latescibacteria bacterium ADurb.Bin168]
MRVSLLVKGCIAAVSLFALGCPAPPPATAPGASDAQQNSDSAATATAPELPDPRGQLPRTPPPVPAEATDGPDAEPATDLESAVYSVQVMSSSSRDAAEAAARQVRSLTSQPVEVVQESAGAWRVYAGRSGTRAPMDRLREQLISAGYSGAWTKQRVVETSVRDNTIPTGESVYSVQIFVSSTPENAGRVAAEVRSKTRLPVEVVEMDGYWKVFVGRSPTRSSIDAERDALRQRGYPDAWTYRRQGTR